MNAADLAHIAVDDSALEVLREKLDGRTKMEGSPYRQKQAGGDVADHRPDG